MPIESGDEHAACESTRYPERVNLRLPALLLAFALLPRPVMAGPPAGEAWMRAYLPDDAARSVSQSVGAGFLEGGRGPWRHVALRPGQVEALRARGIELEPLALPPPDAADGYPSPDELAAALQELAAANEGLAELVQIGISEQGRDIWALRISANSTPSVGWRVLGDHHGDEPSSGVLALATAEHLLEGYGSDPLVTTILEHDEVWVAPMVNPDGVALGSRYNANVVDLNRNYAHEWDGAAFRAGPAPFSEAESRAVRAHGAWTALGVGLSMHAGETNLGWVWNHTATPTAEAELLSSMATTYALACAVPGFWTTNGAEWYPTNGDTNDWSYGRHGVLDFTLEVTLDKSPPAETLPLVVADHLPGVMAFLSWPHKASGRVRDAETGAPVPATLDIGGAPLSTGPGGRFGRPVPADGVETIVRAPGYLPAEISLMPGNPIEVMLEPVGLAPHRPQPTVVSRAGPGTFQLDTDATNVSLVRSGEAPVLATASDDGWQIDPGGLAPGPWTLIVDGTVAPRAIFIGEHDDRVEIDAVDQDSTTVVLDGAGFGAGTRAWALAGTDRSPVPLDVLSVTAERIELDAAALGGLPDPVDLVVLSSGYQLAVVDVFGAATVDTGAPTDEDSGTARDTGGHDPVSPAPAPRPGCSCQANPAVPAGTLVVTLLLVIRRRSR